MTAIGFLLCAAVTIWYLSTDAKLYAAPWKMKVAEAVFVAGTWFIVAGVTTALWKYLP